MKKNFKRLKLAVIGLGYVGLPLALEFAKKRNVIAFDLKKKRINQLKSGIDKNLEISQKDIKNSNNIKFTNKKNDLREASCYIITVPTPIDKFKRPDLSPILGASQTIGGFLKINDIVIYESTVYPGCIEEKCVPILEKYSKLKFNKDFFCGYSPERINPGDKKNKITNIKKITSGSTSKIARLIDDLYKEIIKVGTHRAPSIKVAEASKVIENAQRDINIAFINEVAKICTKINISSYDVLEASLTKWNFLNFEPGLVGGHCIGVDPYYLAEKAKSLSVRPEVILSGRNTNDNMVEFIGEEIVKKLSASSSCLFLGVTFKEMFQT